MEFNYINERINILDNDLYIHIWERSDIGITKPKGIVQFLHGQAEHALRFTEFAEFICKQGFIVYCHDFRGHGRSVRDENELGHIHHTDCINVLCDDAIQVNQFIREKYEKTLSPPVIEGIKHVIIGFSLGSFVSTLMLYKSPKLCSNYIHIGTNFGTSFISNLVLAIIRFEKWRLGPRGVSHLLDDIGTKELNKAFAPTRTNFDYYTRVNEEIDIYLKDPLCGKDFDNQYWFDMMKIYNQVISDPKNMKVIPKDTSILLLSGESDPIGYNGKGPQEMYNHLIKHKITDVSLKLYPEARHDLLHELNKHEVYNDILNFCNKEK